MDSDQKRHLTFPLRLPTSLRDHAHELAQRDGISLNHFISLAVAEKISRQEQFELHDHHRHVVGKQHSVPVGTSALLCKKGLM